MKYLSHLSAKASHYDKDAAHYDAFNENNSQATNSLIEKILKKHRVQSVLDMTCGTGSQVFYLKQSGYEVIGSDINANMLKIAKHKAKLKKLIIKFIKADMRTAKVGQFDAVLTIFNAIGHLTKQDFEKSIRNIHNHLKTNGLYVFDIFNLNYLLANNNITKLTIDWQKTIANETIREIQYSTINPEGVLASYTIDSVQKDSRKPKITHSAQTLQTYTVLQLKEMLHRNGFKAITQCGIDGAKFSDKKTERILMIARKK